MTFLSIVVEERGRRWTTRLVVKDWGLLFHDNSSHMVSVKMWPGNRLRTIAGLSSDEESVRR